MMTSPVKFVPIARIIRRKGGPGKLDIISVECPECREMWICQQSDWDKKHNQYPVLNEHNCEKYEGKLYFLNVSDTGREVVVYGAGEYNRSERASVTRKDQDQK